MASYEAACREEKEAWRSEWFEPTLAKLRIACLTWEEIIEFIQRVEDSFGSSLTDFYDGCLKFNKI